MTKKALLPQRPRHILVYDEDWEYLVANYGPQSENARLGTSGAIRAIIHSFVRRLKAREEQIESGATPEEVEDIARELGS